MAQEKTSLETLLSTSSGKKFLFLGKEEIFSKEEIARFLKKYDISMTKSYEEGVVGVIEHHTLNPVEEDISNMAYDDKIPTYDLISFEKLLSEGINDDELLMIIKLSNDQERIFRLLGNANIDNDLFVKLLGMYEWHEDEEDHRGDRDVIMYTLRRYIKIKPNEEDLLYSYLTLRRLATETTDPNLLRTLIGFPNFSFIVRGKPKISLRETIARNKHIDKEGILKLMSLRDEKVDVSLVGNKALSLNLLQKLQSKEREEINEALATNTNIDDTLFEKLLSKEEKTVQLLLLSQSINMDRFKLIEAASFSNELFSIIGANEQLTDDVIDLLIQSESLDVLKYLGANETLNTIQIKQLYDKKIESLYTVLARNSKTAVEILESFYKNYGEQTEMLVSLAYNKSTPEAILRELYERDRFEIYQGLATNASVPMELLDELKVDTRLQNELAQNDIFIKEYETVLEYDGKAIS